MTGGKKSSVKASEERYRASAVGKGCYLHPSVVDKKSGVDFLF